MTDLQFGILLTCVLPVHYGEDTTLTLMLRALISWGIVILCRTL